MNFELSAEQELLRASTRRWLEERAPLAWVRKQLGSDDGLDPSVDRELSALGLPGLLVPEALGGAGLGTLELGVVLEEMGRALHPGPFAASALGAVRLLAGAASPAVQREILPALAAGTRRAAWVALEDGASGADGSLSGARSHVLEAGAADLLLVTRHGALYAVAADAAGVRVAPEPSIDPTRKLFRVELAGAPARRLGDGDASEAIAAANDALAVGLVADGVGAAARALELAVAYARERVQFGRPIGSFQGVQHLLVDMLQDVELARAAAYSALWAQDAAPAAERRRATALAKAFASEALPRVGAGAIQVFGGIGFTFEADVHLYYRRLVSLSLLHGTASEHFERLARSAFGECA